VSVNASESGIGSGPEYDRLWRVLGNDRYHRDHHLGVRCVWSGRRSASERRR